MNCEEIILDGILNKKPIFGTYLFRKFEESQYEAEEFFFDCEAVFNQLEQAVSSKYNKQKSDFFNLLAYGSDEGKDFAKVELAKFNPDNHPYNLGEKHPKYAGCLLTKSDIEIIRNGINEARKKTKIEIPTEFEKWLKRDDLFDYYIQNPEQRQSIFEDYQREQVFKDVDGWLQWMTKNTDIAKKHFPDFTAKLEKRIKDSPPHLTANIIQKLPENFFIWKSDIEKFFGLTKTKKIKEQILLLELILKDLEFDSEVIQNAVESVRDELTEQLEYWKNELKNLPPQPIETNPETIKTKTVKEAETTTFKNNFDRIAPVEIYKHFKAGLVDKQYLTDNELNDYLKTAFELKTIPETLFKIKDAPKKAAIEAIFYKYYKNVAGKTHGKQKQYAALLGDYFEGYKTTTVSSNFSKSVY